jgi:hypothetical protein
LEACICGSFLSFKAFFVPLFTCLCTCCNNDRNVQTHEQSLHVFSEREEEILHTIL